MSMGIIRRKLSSARFKAREMLGRGALPNTIILGAAKSGTTSLFEYLAQHPEVCPARVKELRFFDNQWEKGARWYRANFSPAAGERVILESTPAYFTRPEIPGRIRQLLERPRFIVLLREPVARAYSHFNYYRSEGLETLSIAEAIRSEHTRHHRFSYRLTSTYAPHIERWLAAFPRDQFLFLKAEDLFSEPRTVFSQVAGFLGISPTAEIDFRPHNQRNHEIPADARALLRGAFVSSNARVKDHVGINWD